MAKACRGARVGLRAPCCCWPGAGGGGRRVGGGPGRCGGGGGGPWPQSFPCTRHLHTTCLPPLAHTRPPGGTAVHATCVYCRIPLAPKCAPPPCSWWRALLVAWTVLGTLLQWHPCGPMQLGSHRTIPQCPWLRFLATSNNHLTGKPFQQRPPAAIGCGVTHMHTAQQAQHHVSTPQGRTRPAADTVFLPLHAMNAV